MKKYFVLIIFSLSFTFTLFAQDLKKDSLFTGRVCKLILYNGYQAEGRITERKNDTLAFETDIVKLFIPVKDIKFVLNPEVELSDLEENDTLKYNKITEPVAKIDTSAECDVYFDNKSVLKDVRLILVTDSTLKAIRDDRSKIIKISGIRKIVFKPIAPFVKGMLVGAGIGFLVGFLPVAFSEGGGHPGYCGFGPGVFIGLICAIPAGLIGGVVGVLVASDDVYLFDKGVDPKKTKRIRYIIEKHY
jgi:hypothetical protein